MTANGGTLRGMRIGVLIGCTAWILLLSAICAATGRAQYLLPVCLPLLLASLGLGLLVLAIVEPMARAAPGPRPPGFQSLVLGATWISVGMLALLVETMVAPMLAADRTLAEVVRGSGGVLALPRWLASAFLAGGCGAVAVGLRKQAGPAGPPPPA